MFILNSLVVVFSLTFCSLLSLWRLPGTELLGVTPYWLLIWLIAWSIRRSVWEGAVAGLAVGWIFDSLTVGEPSHGFSFVVVGVLTASLDRDKYLEENLASIALVAFVMTAIAQTLFALQLVLLQIRPIEELLQEYLRIAIASAVITSLWSPAIYLPLSRWWQFVARVAHRRSRSF